MGIMQAAGVAANDEPGGEPLLGDAVAVEDASPAFPRDVVGRIVLGLLRATLPGRLDDLRQPRAASLVQRLRCRITLALLCALLCVPIAVWLLVRGVQTYFDTEEPACAGPLRDWLLGFLCLQLVWPACMPSMTLLLLGWSLGGMLLLQEPPGCPELRAFGFEALVLQTVSAALLTTAGIAALTCRQIVQRLDTVLSNSGTDPDVLAVIPVMDSHNVTADQECVICLSREDDADVRWRKLPCGHSFHELCLLEWLLKARRCPVCRLDLHVAYHHESGEGSSMGTAQRGDSSYSPVPAEENVAAAPALGGDV